MPRKTALVAMVFALSALPLGLGCREQRHRPWDQPDAAAPSPTEAAWHIASPASSSFLPPSHDPEPSDGGSPTRPSTATSAPDEDDAGPAASPVRVGGPWVRCYGNFHVSGDPVKDVTRLSLLCGPENGMKRVSLQPIQGSVAEGGLPVTEIFLAKRGECYRVFAAAEPSVADLDVIVRSSRGSAVAADHSEDSWPVVQPDRPFCPLEDDRYTLEIAAHKGQGRFAAEIWALRTPKGKPARRFALPDTPE